MFLVNKTSRSGNIFFLKLGVIITVRGVSVNYIKELSIHTLSYAGNSCLWANIKTSLAILELRSTVIEMTNIHPQNCQILLR